MTISFTEGVDRLSDADVNLGFFKSLDYVFQGLLITGIGVWFASICQIMFIPLWLNLIVTIGLIFAIEIYCSDYENLTLAVLTYYAFTFWMGISLFGTFSAFSLILTPQVVIAVVGYGLLGSAFMIGLSLVVFAFRSNQKVVRQIMPSIYTYSSFLIIGMLLMWFFINPANLAGFMFVDGLISTLVFSVLLFLDTFKAAYLEGHVHPIRIAVTIYLDICNIILGLLKLFAASQDESSSDTLYNAFMSMIGFVLPIAFGLYLIIDSLFKSDRSSHYGSDGYFSDQDRRKSDHYRYQRGSLGEDRGYDGGSSETDVEDDNPESRIYCGKN